MKSLAKFLLVGAVAVMAIAISAAPSEAAKKKRMAKAPADTCQDAGLCASQCNGKTCAVMVCSLGDHKWVPAVLTPMCIEGQCPPKC